MKGWVNNRDVGDLRRSRAHYDVTVMNRTANNYQIKRFPPDVITWQTAAGTLRQTFALCVLCDQFILGNSSFHGQNGRNFANAIFKCSFTNETFDIFIPITLKSVHKGVTDNKSALFQVMARRRTRDKPLPEPMMTQFTHAYKRC